MTMKIWMLFTLVIGLGYVSAKYPISGSWFKDRYSKKEIEDALTNFQKIGGDTIIQRGPKFLNRTQNDLKMDPIFSKCVLDGIHCTDVIKTSLMKENVTVEFWTSWRTPEKFTNDFIHCKPYDELITIGNSLFYQLVLSTAAERDGDECGFKSGENVGVVYTMFDTSKPDPRALLATVAEQMKFDVYTGLPEPPRIRYDDESADFMQLVFQLIYRLFGTHQKKYSNNKAFKGYYSDTELNPGMIITNPDSNQPDFPPRYVIMFWRELMFLTGNFNLKLLIAPHIDLRRSSPTNITNIIDGLKSIMFFATPYAFLIKDGRANGTSAYFQPSESDQPIFTHDPKLWEVLYSKNRSISKDVAYMDVYSNSTNYFFSELNEQFGSVNIWLMIEAYNELSSDPCLPLDPAGSGIDRVVERIHKQDVDRAIAGAGEMVDKIAAFAWDPLFLCHKKGNYSLYEELVYGGGVISKCEITNTKHLQIDVYGFGIFNAADIKIYFHTKKGKREGAAGSISRFSILGEQHQARNSKLQLVRMKDILTWGVAQSDAIEIELVNRVLLFGNQLKTSTCILNYATPDIDASVFG